jgi:hypothetical protein
MKKVNIKSFWNGTIMSDLTLTLAQYKSLQNQLQKDFFAGCDNVDEFIDVMNHNEKCFEYEYNLKGYYEVGDTKTQTVYMLGINSIVRKGIKPNNDKFGLVISKF